MILRELLSVFGIDFDETGADQADKALEGLKGRAEGVGQALEGFGRILKTAGILAIFNLVTEKASEAQETLVRTDALFGAQSEGVRAWAEGATKGLGRAEDTLLGLATTLKPVVDNFTKNDAEAAKMSTTMAELAVNMGAFFGETDTDALNALRSGIMGMDRPLKKYGVQLNEDAMQQYALARGFTQGFKALTEQQKAQLRYQKITESMSKVQGAAQKSLDRWAGASKQFKERLGELAEAAGSGLLGTGLINWASNGIERFLEFAKGTNLLTGVMWGLGIVLASIVVPWLAATLLPMLPLIATFATFALIMDDVITTFQGGDSVLSRFTKWVDDMESRGFPGLGKAAGVALIIFQGLRDVIGTIMNLGSGFIEGLIHGNWKDLKAAWSVAVDMAKEGGSSKIGEGRNVQYMPSPLVDLQGNEVKTGNTNNTINVTQQPGENSEAFAKRVVELLEHHAEARDHAIQANLVQSAAGAGR